MDVDTADLAASLAIVVLAAVAWLVAKWAANRWMARMEAQGSETLTTIEKAERHQRFLTIWSLFRVLIAIVVVVSTVIALMYVWDIPTAPLLAVGSVLGVGLGFGAQDYVKSVIAGINIIAEDQYSIGDVVSISGVSGTVEDVRLRVTVLRDLEGNVHYVPNGDIVVASNLTQKFSSVVVDVAIGYGEDVDHAIDVIEDEARSFAEDPEWADVFLEPPTVLGVNQLGDWSVDIRAVLTVAPDNRWSTKREFLRRIKNRLDAEGIEIPFPYRTIVEKPARGGSGPSGVSEPSTDDA
jgi:small conductance mechanosensitive channel